MAQQNGTNFSTKDPMDCQKTVPTEILQANTVRHLRNSGKRTAQRSHATRLAVVVLWSVVAGIPTSASVKSLCWGGKGEAHKKVAGFQVVVTPFPDKEVPSYSECQVEVVDPSNNVIFDVNDWSFSIVIAGRDVNGDGILDLVLEAYSGGAHCCWTYYIISLGPKPGLILKLQNNRELIFYDDKHGRIELGTEDGGFDYFDGVCHACSPFPSVYLRVDGSNLVDISREHANDYNEIIRDNQKALVAEERQWLKALTEKPSDAVPEREAVYKALMIVLAYLYSGREAQARQTLQDLWPPFDQERMWKLILETRSSGILCYTRKNAASGPDAAS
jgi:hypothetical protein